MSRKPDRIIEYINMSVQTGKELNTSDSINKRKLQNHMNLDKIFDLIYTKSMKNRKE